MIYIQENPVTQKIYQGKIAVEDYGDAMDILFVGEPDSRFHEPFSETFSDDLTDHGQYVSVRYYVSDEPRTIEELVENNLKTLAGAADARYQDHYSDVTGYLWTDQELNVGGHDLMAELSSHKDGYLYMIVDFSCVPVP